MMDLNWLRAIDHVVSRLLPPGQPAGAIDAIVLLDKIEIEVRIDNSQPTRARLKTISGQPTVFLRDDDRPERMQWAAAHETGELLAFLVCQQAGVTADDLLTGEREELANLFAQRLLLPSPQFERYAASSDVRHDLYALKDCFATASHELIAMRLLDLETPTVITIFDNGKCTRRRGNLHRVSPTLLPPEQDCLAQVRKHRQPVELRSDDLRIQGWPIDQDDWKREILRTTSELEC